MHIEYWEDKRFFGMIKSNKFISFYYLQIDEERSKSEMDFSFKLSRVYG